jgi:hypothetical protein
MVNKIEGLLSTLYNYFCKSLKKTLGVDKACWDYGNPKGQNSEK